MWICFCSLAVIDAKNDLIMVIRPIKTEQDYNNAVSRIEKLWGAKKDTPEGDEFDLLVTLVESYETKHYPMHLQTQIKENEPS
jgi:antitoxin component HigA of HigAB toxin-antitoxin module